MYKSWMWKQRSYREQFLGDEGSGGAGGTQGGEDGGTDQGAGDSEGQGTDGAEQQDGTTATGTGDGEEEVVVTIGDEAPPPPDDDDDDGQPAGQWVKDLRKRARELARENRELKQEKQAAQQQATTAAPAVGAKPTLESCDFDSDRYETELTAYFDRKRAADEKAAKERKEQEEAKAVWQATLDGYNTAKKALKVENFDDAEIAVKDGLSDTQRAILLDAVSTPATQAQMVFALGNNPAELKRLALISNPVKFAVAIANLEKQLKVIPRKAPPAPERAVRGTTAATPGNADTTLDKLRDEALRTGDASKLMAYKASKRQQ